MIRTLKVILAEKKGAVVVQAIATVFAMVTIFSLVYQYGRLTIIAAGSREAVRNAVISTVNDNYYPSYNGMREGNSGAYKMDSNDQWKDEVNQGNIIQNLKSLYSLQQSGSSLQKTDTDGKEQYTISDLNVMVKNADFASNDHKLNATATYTLNVPVSFFIVKPQPISFPVKINVEFEQKF